MDTSQPSQDTGTRGGLSKTWVAAGAVAVLVLGLLGYGLLSRPATTLQVGSPVPGFQITALDGSSMSLAAEQGNVVVINFFASWCNPCREEAADIEATWRQYQDRGVQFMGIAYKDADSKAQAFLDEFGATYLSAVDPGNRTARAYGVTGVPETFVVDQQGQLVQHFIGPVTQAELDQVLAPLLGH